MKYPPRTATADDKDHVPYVRRSELLSVSVLRPPLRRYRERQKFRNCPYCGEDLSGLAKARKFCPYCSEQLN